MIKFFKNGLSYYFQVFPRESIHKHTQTIQAKGSRIKRGLAIADLILRLSVRFPAFSRKTAKLVCRLHEHMAGYG